MRASYIKIEFNYLASMFAGLSFVFNHKQEKKPSILEVIFFDDLEATFSQIIVRLLV